MYKVYKRLLIDKNQLETAGIRILILEFTINLEVLSCREIVAETDNEH